MQVIEITDLVEARRARLAQYHGRPRALQLNGEILTGSVESVVMHASSATWTVRLLPAPPIVDRKYSLRRNG
jgi:hypothetical protein